MAGIEKETHESFRGVERDVLSLPSSTYASASRPRGFDNAYLAKGYKLSNGLGSSGAFSISNDFVFPPNEHENLPVEPELGKFRSENGGQEVSSAMKLGDESGGHNLESPQEDAKQEENKIHEPGLPCQAWWQRHAVFFYHRAKEARTLWSIVMATALAGVVILGQKWQGGNWRFHQHQWHFNISNEMLIRILGPLSRFRDGILSGNQLRSLLPGRLGSSL